MPIDPNNDIAQAIATARQPDLVTEDDVAGTWSPRSQPISGQTINSYSPTTESAPLSFSEKLPKVLYSHFVDPVVKAVTAPGRVYRGEVPEDQMIDEAKNVAGQLMTGSFAAGVPTALREGIEPNVLRTFAGPASKTAETTAQARQLNDIGLYSHAAEQANTLQPRGDAKQMISTLKNMPGVKAEELQNAGLLDAQGNVHPEWADRGKITNTDLADHLQSSMPQVQETILGFNPSEVAAARAKAESQGNNWDELGPVNQGRYIRSVSGRRLTDYQDDPKYAQYTLPGGENYREVLLTTPVVGEKGDALNKIAQNMFGKNYTDLMGNNSDNAKMRLAVQREYQNQYGESGLSAEQSSMFRSNHWDDPNVLAHLRMSDRTGPNGEKILHVEELQSDWGQKGRDNGFKSNDVNINDLQNQYKELDQKRKETYDQLINEGSASVTSVYDHPDFKQITDKLAGLDQQIKKANNAVPSAPYVTNTGSWTDLALKRALKEAAEGGYDKLVWTPGAEQAERYKLSNTVSRIGYNPDTKELIGLDREGHGIRQLEGKTFEPEELPSVIGKEASDKLLSTGKNDVGFHMLNDQELPIGGEGMKSYYDSIVPKQLQKIVKSYDSNAKIGQTKVPVEGLNKSVYEITNELGMSVDQINSLPTEQKKALLNTAKNTLGMQSLDITPQMRETIMRGQKAFKRGGMIMGNNAIGNAMRMALGGDAEIEMPHSLKELQDWKKNHPTPVPQSSMDDVFTNRVSGFEGAPPMAMPANLDELQAYTRARHASGGHVNDITHALNVAKHLGRGNDTILAHINPHEAALLKAHGGSGKINPYTGLMEFDDNDTKDTGTSDSGNNYSGGWGNYGNFGEAQVKNYGDATTVKASKGEDTSAENAKAINDARAIAQSNLISGANDTAARQLIDRTDISNFPSQNNLTPEQQFGMMYRQPQLGGINEGKSLYDQVKDASNSYGMAYGKLVGKQYTDAGAAGFLGNAMFESNGLNPAAINPTSGATGLFQDLGQRKADLLKALNVSGLSGEALRNALSGTEMGQTAFALNEAASDPSYAATQKALETATDPYKASDVIMHNFERPGAISEALTGGFRAADANQIYNGVPSAATMSRSDLADTYDPSGKPTSAMGYNPFDSSSSTQPSILDKIFGSTSDQVKKLEDAGKTTIYGDAYGKQFLKDEEGNPLTAKDMYAFSQGLDPNNPEDMAKIQARIINDNGQQKVDYYTKDLGQAVFGDAGKALTTGLGNLFAPKSSYDPTAIGNGMGNIKGVSAGYTPGPFDRAGNNQKIIDNALAAVAPSAPAAPINPFTAELSSASLQLPSTTGLSAQDWANQNTGGDMSKVHARIKYVNGAPRLEYYTV